MVFDSVYSKDYHSSLNFGITYLNNAEHISRFNGTCKCHSKAVFTESAPRPIQSSSCNVSLSVCVMSSPHAVFFNGNNIQKCLGVISD